MNEQECLSKMIAPGQLRPSKPYRGGVIQVWVTRACDRDCFCCTQGSNYGGKPGMITVEQFRDACRSLRGYFGVVGMFGGNPAVHPKFAELCAVMREEVPREQRGIWSNNPVTVEKARIMRETFHPGYSNLNVHLDREAYDKFKEGWPECGPVGLEKDSRHSPVFVSMRDVLRKTCPECSDGPFPGKTHDAYPGGWSKCDTCDGTGQVYDEERAWELISACDINQNWSAMVGVFRGQLRAWFCEVAGAQAMLHQDEPDYPDTGKELWHDYEEMRWEGERYLAEPKVVRPWWKAGMNYFAGQVRKHCHECGVPLRGYGELAASEEGVEQTSRTHASVAVPKRRGRGVEVVGSLEQLGTGKLVRTTAYLQNASK